MSVFESLDLAVSRRGDVDIETFMIDGSWPVITIDRVFRDPWAVRKLALSLSFHHQNGNYPGSMASVSLPLAPLHEFVMGVCDAQLRPLLGLHRYYRDHVFALIDGDPSALNPRQRQPHYDDFCDAAGVIYLSPPDRCIGGTSFWRHRGTGLARVPDSLDDDWASEAIISTRSSSVDALVRHCLDEALPDPGFGFPSRDTRWWERIATVPMRWNRMVIYDSRLFHTPDVPTRFGAETESGRLTQNLYFSRHPVTAE